MENAGTAAYEVIRQRWPDAERIVILRARATTAETDLSSPACMRLFLSGRENEEDSVDGKGKERWKGRRRIAARRPELLWCSLRRRAGHRGCGLQPGAPSRQTDGASGSDAA